MSAKEREKLVAHLAASHPSEEPSSYEARQRQRGRTRFTLRIPADTIARLDALAANTGYSRSAVINSLILLADQARPQNLDGKK